MSDVKDLISEGIVAVDVPLGPLTTYKAGGSARWLATIDRPVYLERLISTGLTDQENILVLGRGSNLVVADTGFDGLVIRLGGEFGDIDIAGVEVTAGGAVPLPRLARGAVDAGVLGLEFYIGVPGSVGGAVRQNAGCFGTETTDRLKMARIVDLHTGSERQVTPSELELSYRHSNVASHDLVVGATFKGVRGDPAQGKQLMREITRWRREHQPGGTLNAGSVFKNPPDITAGELIDRLGLKGMRVGDVAVSAKHANFFVAGPDATSEEIYRLVVLVKDTVFERSSTMLEPELQFVGFHQ
ncbi:MAG TPA: UDP-N-acetylmuramate dehydrogenase [Acidimicrobiia bacterium]|jgi:UDP-N-acetylmuramate dehydrogenase|nr:UDP-N-acetylmuramate dehydrogenase [Acidimicrobiia bacterium]